MNVALCFSGQLREFSYSSTSFRAHVLSALRPWDPYIFVHTPDVTSIAWISSVIGIPASRVIVESEDETLLDSPPPVADDHAVVNREWHQSNSFRRFYLQLRSIYRAHSLATDFSRATGVRFDWMFRLRFDNLYFGEVLEDLRRLDPSALYVPQHDNWAGLNDRFGFGGPLSMQAYCSRYTLFTEYQQNGYPMHPESFLQWTLQRTSISVKRTRITLHLIRYGSLWPATFKPSYGDAPLPRNLRCWALWSRLLKTRYSNSVCRFYLFTVRITNLALLLRQFLSVSLNDVRNAKELQPAREELP